MGDEGKTEAASSDGRRRAEAALLEDRGRFGPPTEAVREGINGCEHAPSTLASSRKGDR